MDRTRNRAAVALAAALLAVGAGSWAAAGVAAADEPGECVEQVAAARVQDPYAEEEPDEPYEPCETTTTTSTTTTSTTSTTSTTTPSNSTTTTTVAPTVEGASAISDPVVASVGAAQISFTG